MPIMNISDYLIPREYVIKGSGKKLLFKDDPTYCLDEIKISWRGKNMGMGKEHWAITRMGTECLSKKGEWECEPMPSSRDDKFIERCRYDSVEEALETYLKYKE